MAFDRNNPADLLALKNEVTLDPLGMGYDVNGNTNAILDLLNTPASNVGNDVGSDYATAERMLKAIFDVNIGASDQFRVQLVFEIAESGQQDLSSFKSDIGGLSAALQTAIDGITRPLSRAEVLFSSTDANGVIEYESISRDDWIAARDS